MLLAALLFIPVARWYQPKEYLQDEAEDENDPADPDGADPEENDRETEPV